MDLVYKNEKKLFVIMLVVSVVLWIAIVLGTVGAALFYGLIFFLGYCFAQSALISYIKGTGVRITEHQFPDLKHQITACCHKLGLADEPDAYLLQMGGSLNAFATRFLGRDFLVLYSEVVDATHDNPDALNFYIGHEIGHIKRRHLTWSTVLLPASVLPLLGAAYSRAREYTCDRHGLAACEDAVNAQLGLAALAAGGKRWRTMSTSAYIAQAQHTDGFWMSFHELVGDYPWLVKRMGALKALAAGQEAAPPTRHPMAMLLALFVPRFGIGGGGASLIVMVAIVGVLAAVAIPAYQVYVQKAKVAEAYIAGQRATAAVDAYFYKNNAVPPSLDLAGVAPRPGGAGVELVRLNPRDGVVEVVTAVASKDGQGILVFTPTLNEQKRIVWTCSANFMGPALRPPGCR
jgi:Zn-dependent protease with chaperone function/type II secretory pathway pseudopilin PulG